MVLAAKHNPLFGLNFYSRWRALGNEIKKIQGIDQVISAPAALVALCDYATLCHPTRLTTTTPLFHFLDGTAVHRSWLMQNVERLLHSAGHDPRLYSSHSFRKGGAVSLQDAGVEDSIIRRSGRWKSDAFHLYVRHATIDSLVSANARL